MSERGLSTPNTTHDCNVLTRWDVELQVLEEGLPAGLARVVRDVFDVYINTFIGSAQCLVFARVRVRKFVQVIGDHLNASVQVDERLKIKVEADARAKYIENVTIKLLTSMASSIFF